MCEVAYSELRGLPTISDRLFGVPIIKIKCLGLYVGVPIYGNHG